MSVGISIQGAAKQALAKLTELARMNQASPLYQASADQIKSDNGRLFLANNQSKGETFKTILSRAGVKEAEGHIDMDIQVAQTTQSSHSFGANFTKLRVDSDLAEDSV